jgi:antirestriction protein ArdC
MIRKFFLNTNDRRTGIEDARKYAEQLIEFAPDEEAKENVARALTYIPPGILDLHARDGVKINLVTLERQIRDVSPLYKTLPQNAQAAIDMAAGINVVAEKRVYVRSEAIRDNAMTLVHEMGHATDAAILRDRARRDPDRYPDVRTLDEVGGDVAKLPQHTVGYLSSMGSMLPGIEPDGDTIEKAWLNHEGVSNYALTGQDEMFAEAFRGYCDTGTPAEMVGLLGKGTRKNLEQKAPTLAALIDGIVQHYNQERALALEAQRPVQPEIASPAEPELAQERGKRDFRQEITEKIVSSLEAGKIPWEKPWEFTLPFNGARGNQYHGINQLILMLTAQEQKWSDPRWFTFKQALDKGWSVRKGEHSTTVEYWKPPERLKDEEIQKRFDEAKKKNPELDFVSFAKEEQRKAQRWQVFYARVFNAAQIDVPQRDDAGNIVKEIVEIDGKQVDRPVVQPLTQAVPWAKRTHEIPPIERIEKLLAATGARFEYGGGQAYYSPARDVIVIPPRDTFKSVEGFESTRSHELGHWTGHKSRLDRSELQKHPFGSEGYAKEELRAELASVFLSAETGIPYDVTNHAAYIQSWVKALREDKNEIFKAAKDAEKITDYVLAFEKEREIEIMPDQQLGAGVSAMAPSVYGHETIAAAREAGAFFANSTGKPAYLYMYEGKYGVTAHRPEPGNGFMDTQEMIMPQSVSLLRFSPMVQIGEDHDFFKVPSVSLLPAPKFNRAPAVFGHTHDEALEVAAYYANRTGKTAYLYQRDGQYGVTAQEPSIEDGYTREYILPQNTPSRTVNPDLRFSLLVRFSPLLQEAFTTGAQINFESLIDELERTAREGSVEDYHKAIDTLNYQAASAWEHNHMTGLDYALAALQRLENPQGRVQGVSPFMPQALLDGKPVDLSSLPIVNGLGVVRTAEQVPYDFNARVAGRDAAGEHVIAKLGNKAVAIGREAFSQLPSVGELVEVKRDGDQTKALTEREVDAACDRDRDIEREAEIEVA